MKCPRCGNEINAGEVFCGQCGTPSVPPVAPTALVQSPFTQNGQLQTNAPYNSVQAHASNPPTQTPVNNFSTNVPSQIGNSFTPQQPVQGLASKPNQHTGFYHDETQAIPMSPGLATGYPLEYVPQNVPNPATPRQGGYPNASPFGAQGTQLPNSYRASGPHYIPPYAGSNNQGYGYGRRATPIQPPQKQQHGALVLIICICLVVAIISVVGLVTLLITKNHPDTTTTNPVTLATVVPTPLPTPTPTIMPTDTPIPSPAVTPTLPPDAGFTWCGLSCANYGFAVEYPATWPPNAAINAAGIQFANPPQPDELVTFKAPGQANPGDTADSVLATDLQTNFATKPGFTPPMTAPTTTISGETWAATVAYYQGSAQKERIEVYATVHQGKTYIIELQAPDSLFDSANGSYFMPMLNKFHFLS